MALVDYAAALVQLNGPSFQIERQTILKPESLDTRMLALIGRITTV
jgi:hypothetical protein